MEINMRLSIALSATLLVLLAACANETPPMATITRVAAPAPAPLALETIPPKKDTDLRLFYANGAILTGTSALQKMDSDAKLTMWLAGNQFFAMEEVIHAFQKAHPEVGNVAVITLPPGVVLKAIKAGGWTYEGKEYRMQPDIYGSVDLGHLKALKAAGKMDNYMVYTHNQLELMVAKGNPKKIKGIDDLGRDDLRVMLPNPVDEGIMTFYAKKVLINHKLWDKISGGGKECKACAPSPNVWFTTVHHREIPEALKTGKTDVGIVWATETKNALDEGAQVDKIVLPPQDSLINEVSYVIGTLTNSKHAFAANAYLDFLKTAKGQDAYSKFGFVNASKTDIETKPIP
jgi:ABC-type molybdate transport system substrate-binding protein